MTQFVYKNHIHHVDGLAPSISLLQYIRLHLVQTGTKEGCAAGDCGACTVVVGELHNDIVEYSAINACITPLASIHGKHLILVEDIAADANELEQLHPVQRAMVECHGSQCGFCTPGIVMSLYAWWLKVKTGKLPANRHSVEQALSGNLCRCTGYQPIFRAALKSLDYDHKFEPYDAKSLKDARGLLQEIKQSPPPNKPVSFWQPTTSKALVHCLEENPNAQLIAGATDLGLEFTQALKAPLTLIYTRSVVELNQLEDRDEQLVIGAGVTYSQVHQLIKTYFPAFAELLERLGSLQIRNQGTLGGNIANASPIGDTPPVLLALNAKLIAVSATGERTIGIDSFFTGYRKTVLKAGEALQTIKLPKLGRAEYLKVYKISKRFDDDISAVCLAIWIKFEREIDLENTKILPRVVDIRIGCGGMAAVPARAYNTEKALLDTPFDSTAIDEAKAAIHQDFSPIDDVRASAKYRLAIAGSLLERCRQELFAISTPPPWDLASAADHPVLDPSDAQQSHSPLFYDVSDHSAGGGQ